MEAKINFYDVRQCGLFEIGKDQPTFADLANSLEDLHGWVHQSDMTFGDTATFEVNDSDSVLQVYCYDIQKSASGNFLLTTWNRVPTFDGRIASVVSSDPVGHAEVKLTKFPKGSIPGYPTYFWFIPKENIFATIRFDSAQNGHAGMRAYMKAYIEKFSKWVVANGDSEIIGYSTNGKTPKNAFARFKSYPIRNQGQIGYLKNSLPRITTIERKNCIQLDDPTDNSILNSFFKSVGIESPATPADGDINVKYRFPVSLSEEDFENVVAAWDEDSETDWDDIGFKVKGDSETYWLGHSLAKSKEELDIKYVQADMVVDASSLLKSLNLKQSKLLKVIE